MKVTRLPLILFLLPLICTTSCKKNSGGTPSSDPPTVVKVVVSTIAGDGTEAFLDGPALSAHFHDPVDVAVAPDGTIYVADFNDGRIRKISGGQVSTLAGSDTVGFRNGGGASASFEDPYRIAVDGSGNVFVIEQTDPRVRKITPDGYTTTYAGVQDPGFKDGGSLTAQFALNAEGIATDAQGNVYIGDTFNNRIRKITTAGQVNTFAGTGDMGQVDGGLNVATFRYPDGIVVDHHGNIFVADAGNFSIRKITPAGQVSRFAGGLMGGTRDGDADTAEFISIGDLVIDAQDNIYVSDDNRIRMVTPKGYVTTIAGGDAGYAEGNGATARFHGIGGLGIDAQGNIYVADIQNNRIRKISF